MSLDTRRLPPIYDALDTGAYKTAIQACNKILKKHPKSLIVKTLKSLALLRSQKHDEAVVLADEVFAARPTDENVLIALAQILRHLERHQDIISLYEDAYKKEPRNEELGSQAFMAMVRIGSWKTAQQLSHKLSKTFGEEYRYLSWSVMCAVLQACDPITDEKTKFVLLSLALRLFQQLPPQAGHAANPDKLCLLLEIYLSFTEPMLNEAYEVLSTEVGKAMVESSLAVDERRRDIWARLHKYAEERNLSVERLNRGDRNWLTFLSYLDSVFAIASGPDISDISALTEVQTLLRSLSETDGRKERGSHLARLEFETRLRALSPDIAAKIAPSEGREPLGALLETYFDTFGDKACCFEDLSPYVHEPLSENPEERSHFVEYLTKHNGNISTLPSLGKTLTALKLTRFMQDGPSSEQSESAQGVKVFQMYLEASRSGAASRDQDELDPADGLALLAANHFVQDWVASGKKLTAPLHQAILVLEYASSRSIHNYQFRLLLIRLYLAIGAHSLARTHYKKLQIRTLQHETLSHFIMDRATTWCVANDGDLSMIQEALDASQIYQDNIIETPEMLTKALLYEKYSQIQNFIEFEDRLDRSLQRDMIKIDHVRMRFVVEPPQQDTLTLEIGELDYMYLSDKVHHDNRDFKVIPSFQPHGTSLDEQTTIGPRPGVKWCDIFVQIYIRLLNRAAEPDFYSPHLFQFTPEDLSELTEAEKVFVKYAEVLSEWLWPSGKPRPVPGTTEGDPRYGPQPNGTTPAHKTEDGAANGHAHVPFVELAESERTAEGAVACVEQLNVLLKAAINGAGLSWEVLHIASLIQEALVILNIQSMPFGPQTVNGKPRKADPLWASIKTAKAKLVTILHDASTQLVAYAEAADTADTRAAFIKDCEPIIAQDAELAKFSESIQPGAARKSIILAMGHGIGKIADGKRPVIQILPNGA